MHKSVWENFSANNPQQAQAIQPFIRECLKGVTAQEMLQRKLDNIRQVINDKPELQEAVSTLKQKFIAAGRSEQDAQS